MSFLVEEEEEKLFGWCLGDKDAVVLLQNLAEISQIADDFADNDISDEQRSEQVTRLLHLALVAVPTNPFFIKHGQWLVPVMSSSMYLWNASNEWQNEYGLFAFWANRSAL